MSRRFRSPLEERRLTAGLCSLCDEPRQENDAFFCAAHREQRRERTRRWWDTRGRDAAKSPRTHGKCVICGARLDGIRRTYCSDECHRRGRSNGYRRPDVIRAGDEECLVRCFTCCDLPWQRPASGCPSCGEPREPRALVRPTDTAAAREHSRWLW